MKVMEALSQTFLKFKIFLISDQYFIHITSFKYAAESLLLNDGKQLKYLRYLFKEEAGIYYEPDLRENVENWKMLS